MHCRFCKERLVHSFCDLGSTPISNAFLAKNQLGLEEPKYPLHPLVCHHCFLVQLPDTTSAREIFSEDYPYFSSYSSTWLEHCASYVTMMLQRFKWDATSQIVEIASNDGYLLQYFKAHGIPILGIEPAENVAKDAQKKGVPTLIEFFGFSLASRLKNQGMQADLLLGNNVLAHVPDINDFIKGLSILLKKDGVITMEFPHLVKLIEGNQFDTIYHEHLCYLSFFTVEQMFAKQQLRIFDVDQLSTHGGSLRIYATHENSTRHPSEPSVEKMRSSELYAGYATLNVYQNFSKKISGLQSHLRKFLEERVAEGKKIAGYGAPAKGNTLLNYCEISPSLMGFTVDLNPSKQGKYLPGTKIPIYPPEHIFKERPDYLVILPWNLKDEIMGQLKDVREWGAKFVIPIPQLEIIHSLYDF